MQKEGREKEGVGESVENISLLSSMMETIPNFRILLRRTNTYARARARAHRHSFQSFVSRCTRKRSSIGVACDTASCNASPESGLKAVYTRLACASFHSRRRKRRSSEKDDGEGRNISRKGRRKSLKRNTGGSRERYIGNGDKDFRERGKKIRRDSGRHRIEENSRARRENGERKRRRG